VRKKIIVGGLVIVALLALVAGATFAIFSDNVVSDEQTFAAGTVDITVDDKDEFFETILNMENMEPGDCSGPQKVTIKNVGTLPVDLWNWIYTWSDDPTRPNIFNCDPNPACNMYVDKELQHDEMAPEDKLYPVCSSIPNPNPGVNCRSAGPDYEEWDLTACLPLCAGNNCQNGFGKMRIFFHAVQQSHLDGWDCVKLMHKEAPYWIPDPTYPRHGNKCYEETSPDGNVEYVVNGYDMTANMPLQLMLNGPGGCSFDDYMIAGDFNQDNVSENCDLYYRAFWTGTAMSCTCSGTGEGVYAIAWGGDYHLAGDPAAVTDGNGDFSGQWTAHLGDPCVVGHYTLTTKFLVKQDASPWLQELDELDYQTIVFDCP